MADRAAVCCHMTCRGRGGRGRGSFVNLRRGSQCESGPCLIANRGAAPCVQPPVANDMSTRFRDVSTEPAEKCGNRQLERLGATVSVVCAPKADRSIAQLNDLFVADGAAAQISIHVEQHSASVRITFLDVYVPLLALEASEQVLELDLGELARQAQIATVQLLAKGCD